jgi:hypothetical protein
VLAVSLRFAGFASGIGHRRGRRRGCNCSTVRRRRAGARRGKSPLSSLKGLHKQTASAPNGR